MIDIKDLYTKVYGDVNPNEVQMRMFTDFLLRKLKYEDLQYISFTHVSNLLESDDVDESLREDPDVVLAAITLNSKDIFD